MKVLIISHNPLTTYHNMGKTLLSLFSEFKKKEICQLYIYPSLPDIKKCNSYYRITDKDILNSYFKFKVKGKKINERDISKKNNKMFENTSDEELYRNKKNKKAHRMLLRDLMWKCSNYFNKDLKKWLIEQKPTHIFVAPGDSKFIYDMAIKCSKYLNIPIISYICDDYFFTPKKKGLLNRLQQVLLKNKINHLMQRTSHIITICEELRNKYSYKFKKKASTIMTGSNYMVNFNSKKINNPTTITYFGNIRCNRYLSLVTIGKELDKINKKDNKDYKLIIYSGEKDKSILNNFKNINSIEFKGFLVGDEFDKIFLSSQILLHVEAFDKESIERVKMSISTKIADSLASGICFFAYGPSEIESIKYLKSNKAAVIATSEKELNKKLLEIFDDYNLRQNVIKKALELASENHVKQKTSKKIYKIIEGIE